MTWVDSISGQKRTVPAPGSWHQLAGRWVYYQEKRRSRWYKSLPVFRVNAVGENERFDFSEITGQAGANEKTQWMVSEDGKKMVWLYRNEKTKKEEFYLVHPDTRESRLITAFYNKPYFESDLLTFIEDKNEAILFHSRDDNPEAREIWKLELQSGEASLLFDLGCESMLLSPDGSKLFRFQREWKEEATGRGGETKTRLKITSNDLSGNNSQELASIPLNLKCQDAVFTPDGSALVLILYYGIDVGEGHYMFALVSLNNGAYRPLSVPQRCFYEFAGFEESGAILLTNLYPEENAGTHRLLPDGRLGKVSDQILLGVVEHPPRMGTRIRGYCD